MTNNNNNESYLYVGEQERDFEDRTRRYFGSLYPRLQQQKVLIIGAGAVGTEVVKNLVMLGLRQIYLVDFDKVAGSNLNRCIFFRPQDHDRVYKVDAIAREVRAIWPQIQIYTYPVAIQEAPQEIWQVPLVIVAVDNNEARHYINMFTLSQEKPPFVINGALGRSFVEIQTLLPGHTACLLCSWSPEYFRDLFHRMATESCEQFFVKTVEKFPAISVLNSMAGSIMTSEAIKILLGIDLWHSQKQWEKEHIPALGKIIHYDILQNEFSLGEIYRNPKCVEIFCRSTS